MDHAHRTGAQLAAVAGARRLSPLRAFCLVLLLTGLACAPKLPGVRYLEGEPTPDGLEPFQSFRVKEAYAKPDLDLSGYDKVALDFASISYERPPRYSRQRPVPQLTVGEYRLSPSEQRWMARQFRDVFSRVLGANEGLETTSEYGPGVLLVQAHVVDLLVEVPGRSTGAETNFTSGTAYFTMMLDLRDAETGEPLVRIADRATLSGRSFEFSQRHHGASIDPRALRRDMKRWARALRVHLGELGAVQVALRGDDVSSLVEDVPLM